MPITKCKAQIRLAASHWAIAPLLLVVIALSAKAGTPRDDLLRLVPEDVGFCLVIQDLRGHSAAFLQSPFAKKLWESPIGIAIASAPEQKKLLEFQTQLQQALGVTWPQLRDDIFGDAVVFAYRPGIPGKEDQEQGLMLVYARNDQLLADLTKRFNELQQQSGDLKQLSIRVHHGVQYQCRMEHGENFAYLHGHVLAFSTREGMLQQVIDLERILSAEEPAILHHLRRLGADQALAALWINPRAFDASFEQKAKQLQGAEATVLQTIRAHWKAVNGIALSATIKESEAKLALALSAETDLLPAAARAIFSGETKPSSLWSAFPDKALLAVAGRLDAAAWNDLLSGLLPEEKRQAIRDAANRFAGPALGKNVAKEVLPCLGPDWGLCVLAPPGETGNQKSWVPHAILALRVQRADVAHAVLKTLNSLALLGVFAYNGSHPDQIFLHSLDKMEGSYLSNDAQFPPGFQPAFAFKDGFLVLGSSPDAIRRFVLNSMPSPAAADTPLFRLSLHDLAQYLSAHQSALAEHIANKNESHPVPKEEIARKLGELTQICQLFNRLELVQQSNSGKLTLSLRLHTAFALGK